MGAELAGEKISCQLCGRTFGVSRDGFVQNHRGERFHYLDSNGISGELVYTGAALFGNDSLLFKFAVYGGYAERAAAVLNFPLSELVSLRDFLDSAIAGVEQECSDSQVPGYSYSNVVNANEYMKTKHVPQKLIE